MLCDAMRQIVMPFGVYAIEPSAHDGDGAACLLAHRLLRIQGAFMRCAINAQC